MSRWRPDLYRGKVTDDPDVAHQLMRGLPEDRAMRDLQAAVAYLRSRPDVDVEADRRRSAGAWEAATRWSSPWRSPASRAR